MQLSCWPRSVLFSIRNEFLRVKDYFQEGPDQPIRADLDTAELLTKVPLSFNFGNKILILMDYLMPRNLLYLARGKLMPL